MLHERVCLIKSPYKNIGEQLDAESELKCSISNADLQKYDLYQMFPKVTYDDWIVCWYKPNNKFYVFNFDDCCIMEVMVIDVLVYKYEIIPVEREQGLPLEYDFEEVPVDRKGNIVLDLDGYCPSNYCGDADDMSCYVYFNVKEV